MRASGREKRTSRTAGSVRTMSPIAPRRITRMVSPEPLASIRAARCFGRSSMRWSIFTPPHADPRADPGDPPLPGLPGGGPGASDRDRVHGLPAPLPGHRRDPVDARGEREAAGVLTRSLTGCAYGLSYESGPDGLGSRGTRARVEGIRGVCRARPHGGT